MRSYLNERLANADNLSGPELLDTIQRLKDIAAKMRDYENAAAAAGAACSGMISSEGETYSGIVDILITAGGSLVATCK
jgi:hypothetical protein